MSEPAVRVRQPIDLEEFERRLRSGAPAAKQGSDPLAELARLVGQDDPFKRVFSKPANRDAAGPDHAAPPHLQLIHPSHYRGEPVDAEARGSFAPELGGAHAYADEQPADEAHEAHAYAVAEAHAAGAEDAAHDQFVIETPADYPDDAYHFDVAEGDGGHAPHAAVIAGSALASEGSMPRRSTRGVILLIAVLSAGAAGFWAAVHAKGSVMAFATGGRQPPVILAGGPTKVQLPNAAGTDMSRASASVLDKGASDTPAKAKVVSNEEQPVDLSQQPKPAMASAATGEMSASVAIDPAPVAAVRAPAEPQALAGPAPVAPTSAALPTFIAAAAAPATASAAAPTADAGAPSALGRNGFPTPKRVKVVSVRPDGSFIGSDAPSASAAVADVAKPASSAAAPDSASQPARAFAATSPAPDAAAAGDAAQPAHKRRPGRPDKASAKPKTDVASDAAAAPADNAAPATRPRADAPPARKPKPTQVADAADSDAAATTSAGRAFAVQLAASPSEQDARDSMQRFTKKYSTELGSHRTTFHRVVVGDKTVYRVRVGNLSHDEATDLCTKLQSSGGSCFVAAQN